MRRVLGLSLVLIGLAAAPPLAAQPKSDTAAEAVFEQGLAKFDAGDFRAACPLLEKAVNLSSTPPLGGMLTLAECWEKIDRPASAWGLYKKVAAGASAAKQMDRVETAQRAAARLEPTLPKVTFRGTGQALTGLRVRYGKESIPADIWDVEVPMDPGPVSFTFEADGRRPRWVTIEIPKGPSRTVVQMPELTVGHADEPPPEDEPVPEAPKEDDGEEPVVGAWGILGIISAVVGVGGVAASLGVIVDAKSKYNEAVETDCNGVITSCRTLDNIDAARKQGDIATGLIVGGLSFAALSIVLIGYDLAAQKQDEAAPTPSAFVGPEGFYGSLTWKL